jgi:hypothetical protein
MAKVYLVFSLTGISGTPAIREAYFNEKDAEDAVRSYEEGYREATRRGPTHADGGRTRYWVDSIDVY